MRRSFMVIACVAILSVAELSPRLSLAADLGTEAQQSDGKKIYDKYCMQCHGETGNGQGIATPFLKPQPRDFTKGKYKIRHTLNGELPLDGDIKSAIINGLAFKSGMAYTGMPPWPNLNDTEVSNLVYYLKTFSSYFSDDEYNKPKVAELPAPPSITEESIKKGQGVFETNECIKCHGEYGRGDGPSAPTLKDDWDNHIRPADLTKRWTFRGGGSREDIFRTITTGFNGTPMPAYVDSISIEDRWHLVNYVYSLSPREGANYNKADRPVVLSYTSKPLEGDDLVTLKPVFENAAPAYIPVIGQVIEPGREFFPTANEVEVRGVYNDTELALMLTWHDIQKDILGKNAPDIEVPVFEPKKKEVKESEDPFAEEEDPFADEDDAGGKEASSSEFSDAVAVQFPAVLPKSFKKPYFLFGDSENPVELWFSDLATSAGKAYLGKGSSNLVPHEKVSISVIPNYEHGEWSVIFKRKLALDNSITFPEGAFVPVSFSIWDGFNEERGNKRGVTAWYSLYIDPKEKKSPYPLMAGWGFGVLLVEVVIVYIVRKRR